MSLSFYSIDARNTRENFSSVQSLRCWGFVGDAYGASRGYLQHIIDPFKSERVSVKEWERVREREWESERVREWTWKSQRERESERVNVKELERVRERERVSERVRERERVTGEAERVKEWESKAAGFFCTARCCEILKKKKKKLKKKKKKKRWKIH